MRRRRRVGLPTAVGGLALIAALAVSAAHASSTARNAKSQILIGAVWSLTGPLASIGTNEKNGAVLAARQINAKGGINGHKIKLQILDDASSPTQAVSAVTRLISDGAVAILGPNAGGTLTPTTALTVRKKVLQIGGAASDIPGVQLGKTLFFMPPKIGRWGEAAAVYIEKVWKSKRVAVLHSTDAAGLQTSAALIAHLKRAGVGVVADEAVDLGATDTSVQWSKIRDAKPDAIANLVTGASGGLTLKTGRAFGVIPSTGDPHVIGYISWVTTPVIALAGAAAEGITAAHVFAGSDPLPEQAVFARTFQRNYGTTGDIYNSFGFDMMKLAASAIAGSKIANPTQKDGPAFANWLETHTVKGGVLTYKFEKFSAANLKDEHAGVKAANMLFTQVKNGGLVRAKAQPKF